MGQAGLARTFDTIKETTGLDLVNLINDSLSTRSGNRELVAAVTEKETAGKDEELSSPSQPMEQPEMK